VSDHPDVLLAEYVDGTLPPEARAEVDAHLLTCDRCRREVDLAGEARGVLVALPEVPAPEGLPLAVRRRAGRRAAPRTARLIAAVAAAAVLVAGGIVILNSLQTAEEPAAEGGAAGRGLEELDQSAEEPAAPEAAAGDATLARTALPTYTESGRDYARSDLVQLGRRVRDEARVALQRGVAPTATRFYAGFEPEAFTTRVTEAIECSLREVPPDQLLVPFSIEAASFEGEPAYVAAFLQGPAPDRPYDRVVLWVVARDSCSFRTLAAQRL
jgi:Putative zinc-finger